MADPVSLVLGILPLLTTALSTSKKLCQSARDIKDAPNHIQNVREEIENFYLLLGHVEASLKEKDNDFARSAVSTTLKEALNHSVKTFKEVSKIVNSFRTQETTKELGTWKKLRWEFQKKEIERLQHDLVSQKTTLNIIISIAQSFTSKTYNASIQKVEAELSANTCVLEKFLSLVSEELEDIQVAQLPRPSPHHEQDRKKLIVDLGFTMRRLKADVNLFDPVLDTPPSPSFRVSSFEDTESNGITFISLSEPSFETARTHATRSLNEISIAEQACSQIFVKGILNTTVVLQLNSNDTIDDIVTKLMDRTGLRNGLFALTYNGKILKEVSLSIREHKIPNNATLLGNITISNSFNRVTDYTAHIWSGLEVIVQAIWYSPFFMEILTLRDFDPNDTILTVKERLYMETGLLPSQYNLNAEDTSTLGNLSENSLYDGGYGAVILHAGLYLPSLADRIRLRMWTRSLLKSRSSTSSRTGSNFWSHNTDSSRASSSTGKGSVFGFRNLEKMNITPVNEKIWDAMMLWMKS